MTVSLPVVDRPSVPRPRRAEPMNFAAVLADSRGHGEELPPPPAFDGPPENLAERARRALYEVADPEFPISVVDLGLVSGIDADETSGEVTVALTLTSTACPCMDFIEWDIRERLLQEAEIRDVTIEHAWDPPWTTALISKRGRELLNSFGVAT